VIRLLVTNGCSFTRGEELSDPSIEAWPFVLARLLGIPQVVNLARDGSSNRRIVRSTVACIDRVREDHAVRPDEVLMLIAWTQVSRHEYYSAREWPEEECGPEDYQVDRHWQGIGPWRQAAGHRPSRAYYDNLWSAEGQMVNLFLDWVLLDRFLSHHGYQSRYVFAFPMTKIPEPALGFTLQLSGETVWGGLPPKPRKSFRAMPAKFPRGLYGHPLAEGHEWIAGSLADWLAGSLD
jgi:Family of unknown function (DUF6071)